MARGLWNVRYRGSYNPGDNRDGVKQGLFWIEESGDKEADLKRAREAADEWKLRNPDVHFIVAVWPAVLFDATAEPEPPKPTVRPIQAVRTA